MREEPSEALAAARAVERSIMNDLAPVYRVWVGSAGRNYRDERAEFIDWAVAKLQRSRGDIANLRFLERRSMDVLRTISLTKVSASVPITAELAAAGSPHA